MAGTVFTKFFWSDYTDDEALKMCSLAAQGLWMRMLAIAAAHEPVGLVAIKGVSLDDFGIALAVGRSLEEVAPLLVELEKWSVFSRKSDKTIYSRRMIRDWKKAETARKNGKGGGNPTLSKDDDNSASVNQGGTNGRENGGPTSQPRLKNPVKGGVAPMVSSHKPLAISQSKKKESISFDLVFPPWYDAYPRHVARAQALKAYKSAIGRGASVEQLLDAAKRYAKSRDGEDPKFTKFPATWLNGDCWLDGDLPPREETSEERAANFYAHWLRTGKWLDDEKTLEDVPDEIKSRCTERFEREKLEDAGQQKLAV